MPMADDVIHDGEVEQAEDNQLHPGIRSYVTTDAEFLMHVQRGIASAKTGPNRDFTAIDTEILRSLLAS
jgi:hypothetical protein